GREANDRWYEVGNVGEEIFEVMENGPGEAYYALDAASKALHETLGVDFLPRLRGWQGRSDDDLPDSCRDAASSALVAMAGGGALGPGDPARRLLFWDWWLREAVPAARESAL